jgi:multiple sugar transport system ATP-binding protein
MTVRQNMGFALKLAKVDKAEINKRVEEAARVLDLTEQLERKPANLSGGQRQRVAMGRAIVRDPAAFLMDEPLSNLDAKLRVQMRAEVSRLQERLDTTTVYVTHDQTEAMTLGDRVAVMRAGLIQQVGTPEELYERPVNLFVAGFIGSPSMNFVPAEVQGDKVHLPFVDVPVPDDLREELADGRHVIVGIRPEHIEVAELVPPGQHEGVTFTMAFDLIESMGSEIYAHFDLGAGGIDSDQLRELAEDAGLGELPSTEESERGIARLSPDAHVAVGHDVELFVHTDRLHYFDPEDGHSLREKEAAPAVEPAAA